MEHCRCSGHLSRGRMLSRTSLHSKGILLILCLFGLLLLSSALPSAPTPDGSIPIGGKGGPVLEPSPSRHVEKLLRRVKSGLTQGFRNEELQIMQPNHASMTSAVALIAGTAVGGGFMALPFATAASGYVPSLVAMTGCWMYLTMIGFVVAELSLRTMSKSGKQSVSIDGIAEGVGGRGVAAVVGTIWVLLQWSTLVAQVARGGELLKEVIGVSHPVGCAILTLLFHVITFGLKGEQRAGTLAQNFNTILSLGFVFGLAILGGTGLPKCQFSRLVRADWSVSKFRTSIPLLLQTLMFVQIVPSVCGLLDRDISRIRTAVLLGSGIPLLVSMIWSAVGIALVPYSGKGFEDPVQLLLRSGGGQIQAIMYVLSFTAIGTTLIGTYMILGEFFDDVVDQFRVTRMAQAKAFGFLPPPSPPPPSSSRLAKLSSKLSDPEVVRFGSAVLSSGPPLLLACLGPSLYYIALSFAGAYPLTVVFFITPPLLLVLQRATLKDERREEKGDLSKRKKGRMRAGIYPGNVVSLYTLSILGAMMIISSLLRDLFPSR